VVDGVVAHAPSTALAAASASDDFSDNFPIDNFAGIDVPSVGGERL
jgi:hypothetical protein